MKKTATILTAAAMLAVPALADARLEPVDYFTTPHRGVYCELLQDATRGGNGLRCVPRQARPQRVYRLLEQGRPIRYRATGEPNDGLPRLSYDRWYNMSGGTVKLGKAPGAINCRIARRDGVLRCANREHHGFALTGTRARTY